MSTREIQWDGKNFAAVQILLSPYRHHGHPSCRLPDGDMSRAEVHAGTPVSGEWVTLSPGDVIRVSLAGTITVTPSS